MIVGSNKTKKDHISLVAFDLALRNMGMVEVKVCAQDHKIVSLGRIDIVQTVVENKKVVRASSDSLRRAQELFNAMFNFCQGHYIAAAEIPVGSQNASSAKASGIIIGILSACPLPVIQVSPDEVKRVTGRKNATKKQMIEWVLRKYPDIPLPMWGGKVVESKAEHIADAVAVAEAAIRTDQFRQAMAIRSAFSS